jgi:hypothetical protein
MLGASRSTLKEHGAFALQLFSGVFVATFFMLRRLSLVCRLPGCLRSISRLNVIHAVLFSSDFRGHPANQR